MKTIFLKFTLVFFLVLLLLPTSIYAETGTIIITSTRTDSGINLDWDPVDGAAKYVVTIDRIPSNSTRTSIQNLSLNEGEHTISVSALDSDGNELAKSGEKTLTISPTGAEIGDDPANLPDAVGSIQGLDIPKSKFNNLGDLTIGVANWLLGIGGALATIAVIYSGIMYMTAANTVAAKGDVGKAEKAKKNLTWAIMGVAIAILAIIIVNEIPKILGG